MSAELPELYLHLTTWLKNLSVESNKLCGGPQDFKSAYLDQLIDCRSVVCQILSAEVETRRKETLQTVVESLTGQIVNLEKIGRDCFLNTLKKVYLIHKIKFFMGQFWILFDSCQEAALPLGNMN